MNLKPVFEKAAQDYVKRIRENLASTGTDASGKTSASVSYRATEGGFEVIGGREYFPAVETGSKPSDKKPGRKMIESITSWKAIRGLQWSPWAIAYSILKRGSSLWRKGGRKNIYSNVRADAQKEVPELIGKALRRDVLNKVKREKNKELITA